METFTRRRALRAALGGVAALTAPGVARATPSGRVGRDRLWVTCVHTGETIDHPFLYLDPETDRLAWAAYSQFWRDSKDHDQAVWIDRRMLGLLADLQVEISRRRGEETRLILTSGYRTPRRNATLEGAAPHSFHCHGRATDMWFEGVSHAETHQIATQIKGVGGVGRYDHFTHLDSGPAGRRW